MHDKQVRRRRAVLVLLVACSLILLTAYFGQSSNSPLHSLQRGIVDVVSPVQEGASKVLSPVRDLTGWISGTIHARSQNSQLKTDVQTLRSELAQAQAQGVQDAEMHRLLKLDNVADLSNDGLVAANVTVYDPLVWYETIQIDRGSGSGIATGDPVVGGGGPAGVDGGLVGIVTQVGGDWAQISELSSNKFAAGAAVVNGGKAVSGILTPAVGDPTTLELGPLPQNAQVTAGQQVITSGFADPSNATVVSYYPPGIPIGTVQSTSYDDDTGALFAQVSPYVDLRSVHVVQVLTKHYRGGGVS